MSWCCRSGKVTPLASPIAARRGGWVVGLRAAGAAGQRGEKGAYWLCQDFTAQVGSGPGSPSSWEKGRSHFPRPCAKALQLLTQERRLSRTLWTWPS